MKNSTLKSSLHNDYITSYFRDQIIRLSQTLHHIQDSKNYDRLFIIESIRKTEEGLRNIRKFLNN